MKYEINVHCADENELAAAVAKLTGAAPAKRGRPAKEADAEAEEPEAEADPFEGEEPEAEAPTLETVVEGFKAYAAKHGKEKAIKVLSRLGAKSVKEIKPEDYPKALAAVALK